MKTYNDITVPPIIRTDRIISAFENCVDYDKVEKYANTMKAEMLSHDFPPILGYPGIIDEDDVDEKMFLNGEVVENEHVGNLVWYVTDGHHRSLAAIEAHLPHLEVEIDFSTITSEADLKQYTS